MYIAHDAAHPDTTPYVDPDTCFCCGECLARAACKTKALVRLDPAEPPFVDVSRCYDCRACMVACRAGAIGWIP